jgi:hypothetical protein
MQRSEVVSQSVQNTFHIRGLSQIEWIPCVNTAMRRSQQQPDHFESSEASTYPDEGTGEVIART